MTTRTVAIVLPGGPTAAVALNGPQSHLWYETVTHPLDGLEYAEVQADTGLGASHLKITRAGYQPYSHHIDLSQPAVNQQIRVGVAGDPSRPQDLLIPGMEPVSTRPAPRPHAALPPWPANDPPPEGNEVHRVPPPELVIPAGPDKMFFRGDFNGVCIDLARFGLTIEYQGVNWLAGANSTPLNMLMTPMAPMYARAVQDAMLTEHAERGYDKFTVASRDWNMPENGFRWTPTDFVAWCLYVQSWGFDVVYWAPPDVDPFLTAAVDAHAIDWLILGKEVDTTVVRAETYAAQLDAALAIVGDIPVAAHFTANYPKGSPKSTFFDGRSMPGFDHYNGRVHLAWQAHQDDSPGKQAAMCYYARMRVSLGGVEGSGTPAPDARVIAFETQATAQLYGPDGRRRAGRPEGECTEEYGCLASLNLLYATRRDPRIAPVAGSNNGLRLPDGSPV